MAVDLVFILALFLEHTPSQVNIVGQYMAHHGWSGLSARVFVVRPVCSSHLNAFFGFDKGVYACSPYEICRISIESE